MKTAARRHTAASVSSSAGQSASAGGNNGLGSDPGAGPSTGPALTAPSSSSSGQGTALGHPMDPWTVAEDRDSKSSYTYTLLKDLAIAPKVNVFGVVKFFKPAYKTRGPDYCMTVTLVDPTLDPSHRGLRCQLFRDDVRLLPQVHAVGDIVRFHRLKITLYNGDLQGQKGGGFHSLVFEGAVDAPMDPRSSSSDYTLTDEDKRRVRELRLWSSRLTQLVEENRGCALSKTYAGEYFDLTCQVLSVALLPAEMNAVVRVWDGTKYKGPVRVMDTSGAVGEKCDDDLVRKAGELAYDVSLYDNHMMPGAKLKPGQFIKFCNLHAAKFLQPGRADDAEEMVELVLHRGTSYGRGVIELKESEQAVKDMIKRMEDVVHNAPSTSGTANQNQARSPSANQQTDGPGRGPQSANGVAADRPSRCMQRSASVITDHFHQRTTPIADVINSDAPNKFHLRAKVVDYLPLNILDFTHLYCSKCKFRSRVPKPSKAGTPEKATPAKLNVLTGDLPRKSEYNLRSRAPKEAEARKEEKTHRVDSRSALQGSRRGSPGRGGVVESPTRGQSSKLLASEGTSGGGSSPRKRSAAAGVAGNEGPTSSKLRKNRRGTSKMTAVSEPAREGGGTEVGEASPGELGRRLTGTDKYGRSVTAEVQRSDGEGEVEGSGSGGRHRRRKIKVDVDSLTPREALGMVRLGMRLVSYAGVPISSDQLTAVGANQQSADGQVSYLCPRCSALDGSRPVSEDASLLQYKYCLKLCLDDGSGCIQVILERNSAQTFFQGIQATNLHTSLQSRRQLEEAMAKLCPYPDYDGFDSQASDQSTSDLRPVSQPFLDCCVMSYPVNLAGSEVIKYHMFDTSLALDVE